MSLYHSEPGKLIGLIGDEDTCVGFLLGGIGEINKKRERNFFVVNKNTTPSDIEECFRKFLKRTDMDIIMIAQNYADMIRHLIEIQTEPIPTILEIPSKQCPYESAKDSILNRARGMFCPDDNTLY
ncbi:PREDICTED: V-type proton ATPase subunit F-like [Nicrophorus vespilloides]|uniref:V-type proton ATPase subunit F n=1 Tax=Nicrophorus vespilloides TaxID=110193 RepID=A0ABM1MBU9_NICVS|nr:PREDICTED: V-type proton ATPase subunit F-like [Nicrophorus vespilloides]